MPSIKAKITKRLVDSLKPEAEGDLFVWDTELHRFGLRMKPSGTGSYLILYRVRGRNQRMNTFARVGTITPDEARARARRLLAEVDDGGDPKERKTQARAALTVSELCEQYLEAARAGLVMTRFNKPKRASTVAIDEGRVARHIVPLIGRRVAGDLTHSDVQRMIDAIAAGKTAGVFKTKARGKAVVEGGAGTAARVAELLGGIWTWGAKRGFMGGANPVQGVQKHKGDAKERTLSASELARLGAELRKNEETRPTAVAALRLIALTGLRREEACGLRWSEFDATNSCLRMEKTKTGRSMRPIGKPAIKMLEGLLGRADEDALPGSDEFVFPNRAGTGRADLKKPLADLFNAAGLSDARAHDLRRTFATMAAEEGYGDATIGELLGHARRGVTARHYIRRPDAALVEAATRVAARIAAAMDGDKKGQVVQFERSGDNIA